MNVNLKSTSAIKTLKLILLIIVVGIVAGALFYKNTKSSSVKSYDISSIIMIVTSDGGFCENVCNHPAYSIHSDGKFDKHTDLSTNEVSALKSMVNATDFLKYTVNPRPECPSFRDGFDQILLFPLKYGDKQFTTCKLSIPSDDATYKFIDQLLESHKLL